MSPRRLVVGAALLAASCVDTLGEGELGLPRYLGDVRGAVALDMPAPISDRDGNVYVVYADVTTAQAAAWVGHAGGGWSATCALTEGTARGAHGWIGRGQSRAWYWAGDALVEVDGRTGGCRAVLDRDPRTGTDLDFLGVIPRVDERTARTTGLALIDAAADQRPYLAVLDLDTRTYSKATPFSPADATEVVVLAVGAQRTIGGDGYFLVQYQSGGQTVVEARVVSAGGDVRAQIPIATGGQTFVEDASAGWLEESGGVVAGVIVGDAGPRVVTFGARGGQGQLREAVGFTAVGVHKDGGRLWVVGTSGGAPRLAAIDAGGGVGGAQAWPAAEAAAARLAGDVVVLDDRSEPHRNVLWRAPTSAIGPAVLVSPSTPDRYADGTAGWLIAGPSFPFGDGLRVTQVAFVPLGISYP